MPKIPETGLKSLDEKIKEWFSWNKNEKFEKEAEELLSIGKDNDIKNIFMNRIEFGTAGLRGRMGPGFSQMNDLVIIQTAQGLFEYLLSLGVHEKGLVLGYDGRHNSKRFAELTAGIFVRGGAKVYLPSKVCPTPFVPFGVTKFDAAAGVMVTASHNPKYDNGYKVYWSNGAQIISPHDKRISEFIDKNLEPKEEHWDTSILESSDLIEDPLEAIMESYYDIIKENTHFPLQNEALKHRLTYTAMHGVGYPYVVKAFQTSKFQDVIGVKEQIEPDPEFPTVDFPNPEEGKCALELAFRTADQHGSPIILANDPDADRLGVAEKLPSQPWRILNGNEIGALLAWWMIFTYKQKNNKEENFKNVYLLSSTVSSKIAKTIATKEGFSFEETLTGFKWMGNRAHELIHVENKEVLFAFEEAIGFMCGPGVLDKDGVSAAVKVAELVAYLYKDSQTLSSKLDDIYKQYGYHISENSYFFSNEPAAVKAMFDNLRNVNNQPNSYPESLLDGKYKVIGVRDLTTGFDSTQPDKKARLPTSKSSQMITFTFDNGLVATLRTSGTEPKLKYYTELCAPPDMQDVSEIKDILREMVQAIIDEFIEPEKYNFLCRQS